MGRIARLVAPGIPHHVTQRGNRRQQTFFQEADYHSYISNLSGWCRHFSVQIWTYCLMPNHVHLIAVPGAEDNLRRAIGETHKRYSTRINAREVWRGHLWQGRFSSYPLDETYLLMVARYIEMNPVRRHLVKSPEMYLWSSASAHLAGRDDSLVRVRPLLDRVGDWKNFLRAPIPSSDQATLDRHERTGRPLGDTPFIHYLERTFGRKLLRKKPGLKPKPAPELSELSP